jgi:hypothetical protein
MRLGSKLALATVAIALLGTTIALRADVAVAPVPGALACGEERCRCESCGAEHCCLVPETKTTKKWVYATKLVPHCQAKCRNPLKSSHDDCGICPSCEACVRYKRVLVKREVVTTKPVYSGACWTFPSGPASTAA